MTRPSGALVALCFAMLGFHVGVRAVQLSDLVPALGLTPGELGLASSAGVLAGIATLAGGGLVVDRLGRRPALVAGFAGAGAAFAAMSAVDSFVQFLAANVALGLSISIVDLGVNTVASDYERAAGAHTMTGFHSWFSLGAAAGAGSCAVGLAVGIGFRPTFLALGLMLAATALVVAFGRLPQAARPSPAPAGEPRARFLGPLVLLATAIVFFCFFGDGILETFLSTYLRIDGHDVVLAGGVLAAFHAASWGGRIVFQRTLSRVKERTVLVIVGTVASAATAAGLYAPAGWAALGCFAVVGFALSPIVPLGMSIAGRAAPAGHSGRAVGFVTSVGYTAFILSPLTAGAIADRWGLHTAISLAAVTMGAVAALGFGVRRGRRSREREPGGAVASSGEPR
ncbi:MFS transporter [Sinomonas sp. ASV322]|uniref:MFS transporter n=1 Tax=Sinomonas sp. ASV322 TaxID=3041920 RepID=UPI0027DAE80F|nr:MFS transporter [Sinomonas sp. ASV322]MDQ4504043.1 MFS transporter [Sinomonas sp. ASV322]